MSISKLALSQPPTVSPNSFNYCLETYSIIPLQGICNFSRGWFGKSVELGVRQPIINTPLLLACYPKGVCKKEWFKLEEGM
jgi:hypothetical protein